MNEPARPARITARIEAVLIDSDGGRLGVVVTDLSASGFGLETTETLVVGERIGLDVSRYGVFKGQIRWVRGLTAGGVFLEPVQLSEGAA
jgi:hypothetical protein